MISTISFGERLAAKRKAAGLTQEQLGVGLAPDGGNLGKGAISSWEVGRTFPSAAQIPKLCERLKCSSDDLFGIPWDGVNRRGKQKARVG